jgi:membrane-associated phospholipid phosphatase
MRRLSLLLALLVASVPRAHPTGPGVPLPDDAPLLARPSDRPTLAAAEALEGVAQGTVPPAETQAPAGNTRSSEPAPSGQAGEPGVPGQTTLPTASPRPAWPAHGVPPVGTWDIVAAGAFGAALLTVQLAVPAPTVSKWTEQNGFDNGIRSALRVSSEGGRQAMGYTSDALVYLLIAAPFLNATLVAGVEHERWDVGWRLIVLDAQAILLATTITISIQKAVARERPFVQECRTNPSLKDCSSGGQNQSFPSGHTTAAFAAVALECFHHGYLDTSHTGWGAAVCPLTVAAAVGTGILRIAADKHWATDIIVGATIGGLVGYAVPALHLLGQEKKDGPVLTPTISGTTVGLTLAGRF